MGFLAAEVLWPLAKKRDTWYILVIAVLAFAVWALRAELRTDKVALAARPAVETHVVTRTVQGPERIVEKVVKGDVVERTVYKDPVTTVTEASRDTHPACPDPLRPPTRYVGAGWSPLDERRPRIRAGGTLFGRLDLGGYYDTAKTPAQGALGIEAAYRF